jgi:hypothetical protein
MPSEARLRIDPGDGSSVADYRLVDGMVEMRVLGCDGRIDRSTGSPWRQLPALELVGHVERNTTVARWLQRRMGFRAVLRACLGPDSEDALLFPKEEQTTRAA